MGPSRAAAGSRSPFRVLSIASLSATFVLIAIGGLVRATKSGLGCGTDWPDCSGKLIPSLASTATRIEFSHRFAAGIVVLLLAALAIAAYRERRVDPSRLRWAVAAFGLVLWQAVLGAIVVKLELEAESVVLHLGTALALLAVLVHIVVRETPGGAVEAPPDLGRGLRFAAGSVLVLLLSGSYVTGRDAGYVFSDWPLMNGRLVPDLGVELQAVHFAHRALAAAVGVVVGVAVWRAIRSKAEHPLVARYAHVAAGAFGIQIVLGAANIWTRLNPVVVTLHLAFGALIWASLIAAAAVTGRVRQGRSSLDMEAKVPVGTGPRMDPAG